MKSLSRILSGQSMRCFQWSTREGALGLNLISTALGLIPTVYAALVSNSLILMADLLRCLVEFLAVLCTWSVANRLRSLDRVAYNYGLGKFEQLASLVVAGAMFITVCIILFASYVRLVAPEPVHGVAFGLVLAALSVIGNVFLWWRNAIAQAHDDSPMMDSQRRLFRSKSIASVVVLVSLLVTATVPLAWVSVGADLIGSMLLGIFIARSGFDIAYRSLGDMLDRSLEEAAQLIILRELVKHEHEYKDLHEVRTRRSGNRAFIEIRCEFDPELTVGELCNRIDRIARSIRSAIPLSDVTVVPHY